VAGAVWSGVATGRALGSAVLGGVGTAVPVGRSAPGRDSPIVDAPLLLRAVSEQQPVQGTVEGSRPAPADTATAVPPPWRRWLIAAAVLLVVAAVGGVGAAYLVAALRAAPPPDAAFLPTPTLTATPRITASPTLAPTASPTVTPSPSPSAPTPEPSPSPSPIVYFVERGDTLGRIARRFGVTPESIIELNELRNPNRILPGQRLLIPVGSGASPTP